MEVGIRELRDGLSRHLDSVRSGHIVTVTDHGHPIAQIIPINGRSKLDALRAEGLVKPAKSHKQRAPKPVTSKGTVSDLVSDQRR